MARTNKAGKTIITAHEGLRLRAYLCPAGKWTIGRGHTGKDVYPGLVITETEADALFETDLAAFEAAVSSVVIVPLSGNQFSALVSFAYNCRGWSGSTLIRKLNAGDYDGAAAEFRRWVKAKDVHTGQMVELGGLVSRRAAERALFLTPGDGDA